MKKLIIPLISFLLSALVFTGCQTADQSKKAAPINNTSPSAEEDRTTPIMSKITSEKAKELMDQQDDIILLDVRTEEEFEEGHIKGALLIPDYELTDKAEDLLDKSSTILIYCRSGNRSSKAAKVLSELGYNTIYDFGGIIDWPYDIVTE